MTRAFLLLALLCSATVARAEGRCPPGQYPIGSSQGVLGCAPIPGAQQSQQGQGENDARIMPPRATGRWYSRFGALVQSKSTFVVGLSADKESAEDALADARMMCGSEGARDCETVFTYSNQCAAWLVPSVEGGGNLTGISAGKSIREAEKNARKLCKDTTGKKCKTFYSACSKPVFEKF